MSLLLKPESILGKPLINPAKEASPETVQLFNRHFLLAASLTIAQIGFWSAIRPICAIGVKVGAVGEEVHIINAAKLRIFR